MIEAIGSVMLIGVVISCFAPAFESILTPSEATDQGIIPIISGYVQHELIYLTHKRGKQIDHVYLYMNKSLILDRSNFKIGDTLISSLSRPCLVELYDNNHNLLFYGYF